ncbi:integrin alpha-PS5-like [Ischnura elegans]|uniref:integrin alpha-PS5-like n=1 Tax=Ischnura elegans TaxID=197161 RepID=UPI001ED86F3D|nr:integrin alpha-PS5-like [Ischnura elegans]
MPLIKGNEKGSELLVGAPGILGWRGGTVLFEDRKVVPKNGFNKRLADIEPFFYYFVPPSKPSPKNYLSWWDYFGYAVSSGYFFGEDELWYVASAPRAFDVLGKVFIYKVKKDFTNREIRMDDNQHLIGIQGGEYFGASLAAGKINDDDYEDLVVGAPLYSAEGLGQDEGRISIFFGSKTKQMQEIKIFGKVRKARFGSAVSYLDDLDSDGIGEIAVGAPYENDGRGAVYIYSGSKNGIITEPTQKLDARYYTGIPLRGFGSSISPHPADIDGNGCYDVAVGAYKSGHAVVFRGRPVVRWKISPPHHKSHILRNATQFTIFAACVTYLGNHVPNHLTVWRVLDLDPILKRCHINNQMIYEEELNLTRGIEHCEDILISLTDVKTKNLIEPIEIRMRYRLHAEIGSSRREEGLEIHPVLVKVNGSSTMEVHNTSYGFCQSCPISRESTDSVMYVPFEVGCGTDDICHSDLAIKGILPQLSKSGSDEHPEFVIGSSKTLKLKIHVSNKGEPAYLTQLVIELGSPGKIAKIPPECYEIPALTFASLTEESLEEKASVNVSSGFYETHDSEESSGASGPNPRMNSSSIYIRCDMDNPLPSNLSRSQLVEIDMKNVHGSMGMSLYSYVTTISKENNLKDNYWAAIIPFTYKADMEIIGRASRNDLFTFFKDNKNDSETKMIFNHIYEVQRHGSSPVEKVNIIFQVPVSVKGKSVSDDINFLRLISIQVSQSGQTYPCTIVDEEVKDGSEGIHSKAYHGGQEVTLVSNYSTTQVPSNRTLYLNCSSLAQKEEQAFQCMSIRCPAGPFSLSQTMAKILLEMEINVSSLEKIMGLRDIILLESQGFIEVVEPKTLIQPIHGRPDISWASTRFIGDIPKKPVESWVLALAIGGGIMLFAFVAMAMHKAGFFERKKKQELKSLKRKTLAECATTAHEDQEQEIEHASFE